VYHEQDIRKLGTINTNKTFLKITFLICGASLAGLPLFSGYLSKETILLSTISFESGIGAVDFVVPILFISASLFTVIYLSKIAYHVFFKNTEKGNSKWTVMEFTILSLTALSLAIPHSLNILEPSQSIFANYFDLPDLQHHFLGWGIVVLSIVIAFFSFQYFKKEKPASSSIWAKIGFNHFYIDHFYTKILTQGILGFQENNEISQQPKAISYIKKNGLAGLIHKFDVNVIDGIVNLSAYLSVRVGHISAWLDEHIVDGIVNQVAHRINRIGFRLRRLQSGKLQEYLIATILILIFTILVANLL
jgi:NADH-quinone oxidoreductase subunit L